MEKLSLLLTNALKLTCFSIICLCLHNSAPKIVTDTQVEGNESQKYMNHDDVRLELRLSVLEEKFFTFKTSQELRFNQVHDKINSIKNVVHKIKSIHKREAATKNVTKEKLKHCAESSRLCTFFYPDHPDILLGRNESKSHNNVMQRVFKLEKTNAPILPSKKTYCSDSSSFCTYFHPDHPDSKLTKLNNNFSKITNSPSVFNNSNEQDLTGPPTNCKDLNLLGHTLNGYYLVNGTGKNVKKIVTVYCNFKELNNNKSVIGYIDVKSSSGVYFNVQQISNNGIGIIKWDVDYLNVGKAMDGSSGIFRAPVSGIYHFVYKAIHYGKNPEVKVSIKVNDVDMGDAYVSAPGMNSEQKKGIFEHSLQATLKLESGDQVTLYKESGSLVLQDEASQFCGWLIEENILINS